MNCPWANSPVIVTSKHGRRTKPDKRSKPFADHPSDVHSAHFVERHDQQTTCLVFLWREQYTERNFFEILLYEPGIRLYLSFSDWFGSKRTSVWFHINRKMINTIWFRVDLIKLRKYFSVCILGWSVLQLFLNSDSVLLKNVVYPSGNE